MYEESGGEQFRLNPNKVKCKLFTENCISLNKRTDPTEKETLFRLHAEEQMLNESSAYSIILLAAEGLDLEKQRYAVQNS